MELNPLHAWDLEPADAVALQKQLAARVDTTKPLAVGRAVAAHAELVAGADVSYNRFSPTFYAVVVVLRTSDWTVVEEQSAVRDSPFPYIPGLLAFREHLPTARGIHLSAAGAR